MNRRHKDHPSKEKYCICMKKLLTVSHLTLVPSSLVVEVVIHRKG